MAAGSDMAASAGVGPDETKPSRWRGVIWTGSGVILVYVAILYLGASPPSVRLLACAIFLPAGYYLCTWIHEIGHALAAIAVRWRVVVFAVHPVAYHLVNRELARMHAKDAEDLGGYVVAVPAEDQALSLRRWAAVILGGPIANVAFFAILIFVVIGSVDAPARHGVGSERFQWELAGFALAIQSLHVGIFALLPSLRANVRSDGENLIGLYRERRSLRGMLAHIWLTAMGEHKIGLANQPQWLVDRAVAEAVVSPQLAAAVACHRIGRVLDSESVDVEHARSLLDAFLSRYGENEWRAYCDAYLSAVYEGAGERAQVLLQQVEASLHLEPLRLAAEAGVAARLGQETDVQARLNEMDAALAASSTFRDATFRDIRRRIESLADARLSPVG